MAGSEGLVCGLFLSRTAPAYRALPRVLGVYSGAVRSRVEFDEAVAADPSNPDAQSFSFDLDFATADFWPQHATTLERDSVLVDARVQRNEMAFVNDARGCVSRACPLAPGVCAEMHPSDAERISVRFIDVAVGGLPYVVMFQTAHVAPGDELLCDYGAQYWTNIRRAYATRRAVQQLLSPGSHQPYFAAKLPLDVLTTRAPLPHGLRMAGSSGGSGRACKHRADGAPSAGGAKLDELRVRLLQLDGAMPPIRRALKLPPGVSFEAFFENHLRRWRWGLVEAADGQQLIRLANRFASWVAPSVLRPRWNAELQTTSSAKDVVEALHAGVIQEAIEALWKEAERDASTTGQALYAVEEDANWHDVLSVEVARTRTASAKRLGLTLLQLRNGADWRDAVLQALNLTGKGAPPPDIASRLLHAVRRRGSGGGLLDLNNARESRNTVEAILLEMDAAAAGGESPEPAPQPSSDAAGGEEPPPSHRKRSRERREAPASAEVDDAVADDLMPPDVWMPGFEPVSRMQEPVLVLPAGHDGVPRIKVEPPQPQPALRPANPPPPHPPPPAVEEHECIDLTMLDDD